MPVLKNKPRNLSELAQFIGQEIAVSDWLDISQQRVNDFAACTDDDQWLHTDPERARHSSPFGETIAHGYLTLSLLTKLQSDANAWPSDAEATINYGIEDVRFIAPVSTGGRIRNRATLQSLKAKSENSWIMALHNTVEIEGQTKPALVATSLLLVMGGKD
ncbi:MaoC family dehydratase [Ruegeria hyattellae]|uniref:MaoC family dehydratase n=1 Tax=Ruegeria hyattellae TaxID=3233337 RepID=UPI00355B5FC7